MSTSDTGTSTAMASGVGFNSLKHTDRGRWICIYPAYINVKKTLQEGRKIPKAKAVENPTDMEIGDVIAAAGFKVWVERDKQYSRERSKELKCYGRVRVQLKQENGAPCNPNFPTRESLMLHAAEMIPKLKFRAHKDNPGDQGQHQSGGGGKKKGGKKR